MAPTTKARDSTSSRLRWPPWPMRAPAPRQWIDDRRWEEGIAAAAELVSR